LAEPGEGRVIASFASSAYVATGGGSVLCLLPAEAPDGAIHVRLAALPQFALGDEVRLRVDDAVRWSPPDWPRPGPALLERRMRQFGAPCLGDPLRLLGRGPGLTPDGDDRLCGWMIMRRALGLSIDAAAILEASLRRTHIVAQAHLAAAATGIGTAPFHAVLCDLLDARIRMPDLAPLDRIGHHSGHAAFAGAMAAMGEVQRQSPREVAIA